MKTVSIETLLENRDLPRCVSFKVGSVCFSALRRKRKHFGAQFTSGAIGDVSIEEHTIEAGTLCEVADDVL